ncbi:CPBP family intramembrane glutamic endopeptidase [Brevibacterium litoralis]|uniref:CPBP family intramembrane glutamic endopeptidase n=1 Tax=Brevibacterium litoralis TaxID=3138935 RepID=UPI0032EAA4CC
MDIPARPQAIRFLSLFALVVMVAVVLASLPVYLGAAPDYLTVLTPVFQWVPALAVLALHPLLRRRTGTWTLLGAAAVRGVRFGAVLRWSAVALAALVVVAGATLGISGALGFAELRVAEGAFVALAFTLPVILVFMLFCLGEEAAWRGYLTTLLAPLGFVRTTALIGGLWALWHLPLSIGLLVAGEMDGRDVVSKTVDLLLAAVFVSALRYLSGSVWPAVFAHAAFNNLFQMAYYNFMEPATGLAEGAYWGHTAVSWAVWLVVDAVVLTWMVRSGRHRSPLPSGA